MGADEPVVIVPYDPGWAAEFRAIAAALRAAVGPVARRIDHVGSTAVPGLDAKPVIDIQLSVGALEPTASYRDPLEALGYRFHAENPDRSKRYFREPSGARRTHLHVRAAGTFDEQLNLLFRDYLRSTATAREEYARAKHALAREFGRDREAYVRAKEPVVWSLLQAAHDWSQTTGWAPGPSDA